MATLTDAESAEAIRSHHSELQATTGHSLVGVAAARPTPTALGVRTCTRVGCLDRRPMLRHHA